VDSKARSEIGYALLNNPGARVAFCNDFGLLPNVESVEFDLSRTELKDPEPFRLLAGCLKGNRTVTHMKLSNLKIELIPTLAKALKGNDKLLTLEIISASRSGGTSTVTLPVLELTGSIAEGASPKVDMSKTCENGTLNRVTCGMIGALVGSNTALQTLDLSSTGVGQAIGMEGEGGHILIRPLCQDNDCPISEVIMNSAELNDKAGGKLISALVEGLGKGDHGYEKITSLSMANNDLGKQFTSALKQLLWSERAQCMIKLLDVSNNPSLDGYAILLLPTSYFLLPTSYFLLPTSYFLLPTAYCLLPTAYFLLPTSYLTRVWMGTPYTPPYTLSHTPPSYTLRHPRPTPLSAPPPLMQDV